MKIKLSKSQWELIGNKTGWMKTAEKCPKCKEILEEDSEWQGEDKIGKGSSIIHYKCPKCDFNKKEKLEE